MNNEEKILSLLETLVTDVTGLKQGQAEMQADIANLKADVGNLKADVGNLKAEVFRMGDDISMIKEDVHNLKEDLSEVRSGTNKLLDWADRSEKIIGIPFLKANNG